MKPPKLTASVMRVLEPAETKALGVVDERYRAMVLAAACTDLRFGELAALLTDRFDALQRTLRVEESLAEVRGQFLIKPPKSDASRRTVSVPAFVVDELANHRATHADGSGFVGFGSPAVRASVGEPCTFHDLRHTHAVLLIALGEHPKVIQERLGHASIKTTLDTYGHLFEGLDEAAAHHLDRVWNAADVDAMWTRSGRGVIESPSR